MYSYVMVSHAYTLKFRGGQLAHKNNKYFTPRKLPAIRYISNVNECITNVASTYRADHHSNHQGSEH